MRTNGKAGVSWFWTIVIIAALCWVLLKYNSELTDTVLNWLRQITHR